MRRSLRALLWMPILLVGIGTLIWLYRTTDPEISESEYQMVDQMVEHDQRVAWYVLYIGRFLDDDKITRSEYLKLLDYKARLRPAPKAAKP